MLDGQDSIHRYHRIYYAYIRNNLAHSSSHSSLSSSSGAVAGLEREFNSELIFGRTMVLARLGQFIMEVKVYMVSYLLIALLLIPRVLLLA